jgi:tetratricopeptide (TPR) repeat protein
VRLAPVVRDEPPPDWLFVAAPGRAVRAADTNARYCSTVRFGGRDSPEYYSRLRDVTSASRYALVALVVAVGLAAIGLSGRVWAFIPAAIAAVFAAMDALLAWKAASTAAADELRGLLAGNPCRVGAARATEYGVDRAVLPTGQDWRYVSRDFESQLTAAIRAALAKTGAPLVMLSGATKSGKTRAAFEALRCDELRDAWLVVPRSGASVEALLRPGALPRHWSPLIVWLDDIERYASIDASGLHEGMLRNLDCDRPVVLLATEGGRGYIQPMPLEEDPLEGLRDLAVSIEVPVRLSKSELSRAERLYDGGLLVEIEQLGIGRRMVAMSELKYRLKRSSVDSREGIAVLRAAVDWRRAGALRPPRAEQLELLYRHYLDASLDPNAELFTAGLQWTRRSLPGTDISLLRRAGSELDGYEPYDLVVELAVTEWPEIDACMLRQIAGLAEPEDRFRVATTAYDAGESDLALELLKLAQDAGDPRLLAIVALNTGTLLARRGELPAAEAAYRLADELDSQRGAFNLGQLLRERGALEDAESAYLRADERGSPEGAVNLGFLLERRGDRDGALAAYRRAADRGSRKGAGNLRRLRGPEPMEVAERGSGTDSEGWRAAI